MNEDKKVKELEYTELKPNLSPITITKEQKEEKVSYASFQKRALNALQELAYTNKSNPLMLLTSSSDIDIEVCIRDLLEKIEIPDRTLYDICYAENLAEPLSPICLHIKSGTAIEFNTLICDLLNKIQRKTDAEEVLMRILKKQNNDKKLENYLSDLSIHIAQGKDFSHPVLMNLMVCHNEKEVPIIFGQNLTWKSLFGGVNYLTENGSTYSNQHLLEPGLLRKADGGFLILEIEDLIRNPLLWFKLKTTLKLGVLDWDNPNESPLSVVPFFSPEPTPINVRIILVGSYYSIAELYNFDPEVQSAVYLRTDLNSYFKLKDNQALFTKYLHNLAKRLNLINFSDEAILRLIRFSSRAAESQNEVLINEHKLSSLMIEASGKAKREGKEEVTYDILDNTITQDIFRANSVVEDSSDFYKNKQMLITTQGEKVGQINGLSVIQTFGSDFEYGEPVRITATIHAGGEGDISDIEHKAELAGQIHTKAMMIINGYLSHKFGFYEPLPVSTNLVFEQSYSEIDGDSASLTGLCAILSALSNAPIKQQFSVTGAVDQLGNVQPVGGLNEKIEGFYRICKIQGLTGKQGVIIPESNKQSLILSDEVIEAIKSGNFHIYPVITVDDAIEILTGVKAGLSETSSSKDNEEESKEKENQNEVTIFNLIVNELEKIAKDEQGPRVGFLGRLLGLGK